MQSTEIWRDIAEHEGTYEVSNLGRVRSRNGRWSSNPHVMKPTPIPVGYLTVALYKDGTRKTRLVHRLVAEAFISERYRGDIVRHLDGDRVNNVVGNLAWGTASENTIDSVVHGTHRNVAKTHCVRGHEFNDENTAHYEQGKRFCKQCNRDRYHIRKAKEGRK